MNSSVLAIAAWLLMITPLSALEAPPDRVALVRQFVAAFNAQDANAMATMVSDEVQWLAVAGTEVAIETAGRANLVASMEKYFVSCSTCRSELVSVHAAGSRVSALELARWQGKDGPRQQRSLSVYEFDGALIARVYYFPAEP